MTARTVINVVVSAVLTVGFAVAVYVAGRALWRWWLAGWRNALRVIDDARTGAAPAVEAVPDEPQDDAPAAPPAQIEEETRRIDRDVFMPQPRDRFPTRPAGPRHRKAVGRWPLRRRLPDNRNTGNRWTP